MASTKDVVDHHLKCFGERDLTGILFDYAPGAVLFTPDGPLRGADAIRPLFQALIAQFGKPGTTFRMKQQFAEGDCAYILWTAETADNLCEVGTDTFVVRDGKIVTQSFTGKIISGIRAVSGIFIEYGLSNRRWAICLGKTSRLQQKTLTHSYHAWPGRSRLQYSYYDTRR